MQAYRYDGLHVGGLSEPVTVYAVPTDDGVATFVCMGAGAGCSQIAATVHLNGAHAYPLAPSAQYGAALTTALKALNSRTAGGVAALQAASTGVAQAAAAERIAAAYRDAATTVSQLPVSPAAGAANAAVAASLTRLAQTYSTLGRAAGTGDRSGYAAASSAAAGGRASLRSALAKLRAAGYDVSG